VRALSLSRSLAIVAILALGSPALAGEPQPQDRYPGRSSKLPSLDQQFMASSSSQPGTGLAGLDASQLQDYVNSVQSVNLAVAFQTQKGHTTDIGDTSHWHVHHLGPIPVPLPNLNPGIQIQGDSQIKVSASYSKKDGQPTATLDDLKVEAPAAHFGPFGLLSLQKAEIKSNGEIDLKLARYLPTLRVTQITRDKNGDVHLHIKWFPDVYITPSGDVQIHVGPSFLHFTKTIAHVNVNLFAQWPPSLEDFLGAAAAPMSQSGGMVGALSGDTKKIVDSLAGTATYSFHATTKDTPIDMNGVSTKASAQVDLSGKADVKNGTLTTIGNGNTASVKLQVGATDVNTARGGAHLDGATVSLGGTYRLSMPLDAQRRMTIDFNGNAALSGSGTGAHFTLPNGATVRVGSFDGSARTGVTFHQDPNGRSFQLSGGSYDVGASGPIQVENLGKISSLDMDGSLRSQGTVSIGPSGLAQLTGDLHGQGVLASDVPLSLGGATTTLQKGTNVDVALDHIAGAVQLGSSPSLVSAQASGSVGVHGAVGPTTLSQNGMTVQAPGAAVDLTLTGDAGLDPSGVKASGHVTGKGTLEGPTSVSLQKGGSSFSTTLASGSGFSVDGQVAKDASGVSANGAVSAHAAATNTTYTNNGITVNAPSSTLDLTANGSLGKGGTSAHFDANAALGADASVADSKGPFGSTVKTTLDPGSTLGVSGDLKGNQLSGNLSGSVKASNVDATLGPVAAHIPADARIGVAAPFNATVGGGKVALNGTTQATVPIHVALHKGTTVSVSLFGKSAQVTLDTEGTHVDVTAIADVGPNGKPVLRALNDVTINLVLGDVAAAALGQQLGFALDKQVTLKGNASFASGSLSITGSGSFAAGNKGAPAAISFTW